MWPMPLAPWTAAVRTMSVPNVSSSSRDLALAAFCFLRTDFLSARFSRPFSEQMPSVFHSFPHVFYPGSGLRSSNVLGAALSTRIDFSIVDSFGSLRVPSEHGYSPRFGSHVFRGGGVPTVAAGNDFASVGVHHRQSMLLARLHCQHRRVLASIDVMKPEHNALPRSIHVTFLHF